MAGTASATTFVQIEDQPLNGRQKSLIAAAVLGTMLEFLDFFIVTFILTVIAQPWGLTIGQSAYLLLSASVGAIVGSVIGGALGDRYGRRRMFIATVLTFSLATGALALVPEGGWVLFGLLRFVVGLGVGGLAVVDIPLVQEFVPSRRRGLLGALVVTCIPLGLLVGAAGAAFLGPVIGWRGLVLLGLLPAGVSLYVRMSVPESPTWLIRRGEPEEAQRSVGRILGIPASEVILPVVEERPRARWSDLFRYHRSVLFTCVNSFGLQLPFYGIALWGPTLLALQLGATAAEAAFLYIFISLAGFVGRLLAAYASDRYGRRRTGVVAMGMATVFLAAAAIFNDVTWAGVALFFPLLLLASAFLDASFSVGLPYWSEMFPTEVRASGIGLAYGLGGLGKIIGPAVLVLISGAGTVLSPKATNAAIGPAFWFFAVFALIGAASYVWPAIEMKGRSLQEVDELLQRQVRTPEPVVRGATAAR